MSGLCWVLAALAAPTVAVQGTLTGAGSAPLNGTVAVSFQVYNAETGGSLVHDETLTVSFADGSFSAALGSVQALNLAAFGDGELWLSVQPVGLGASERVPVGWSARSLYASRAGDAETVGGKGLADLVEWTEVGDLDAQYLRLGGGTLTGAMTGTDATFTGSLAANAATLGAVSGSTGTFSGALTANGASLGAISGTTGSFSAGFSGTTATFTGALTANGATLGAVGGTTGTFSGALTSNGASLGAISGSTGTFTGALTSNGASLGAVSGTTGNFSGALTSSGANLGAVSGTTGNFSGSLTSSGANLGAVSGTTGTFSAGVSAASATVTGAGAFGAGVKVGPDAATCDSGKAGTIRFSSGAFWGCDGVTWITLGAVVGTIETPGLSCKDIKTRRPTATDGDYWIRPSGVTTAYQAFCDMTTDGGGYTYFAVTGGASTCRFDAANSCPAGMNIATPRTKAHFQAMVNKYGSSYFAIVPGIYSPAAGSYTSCAMKSGGCSNWRATDGGAWYIRDTAFTEPNGDYTPGCWLGLTAGGYTVSAATIEAGQGFNDGNCSYCATAYICSTNDK